MYNKILQRLLAPLRKKFDTSVLPTRSSDIGDYPRNFERAINFTKNCGFKVAPPRWLNQDRLDSRGDFIEPAFRAAGVIDPGKAAGQCLKWCYHLAPHFEQQLGVEVWVTIGQLWKDDRQVFSPTWNELSRWSHTGITLDELCAAGRMGVNLHAWLTLQTGEIIEPTFLSTLAASGRDSYANLSGAVAWGRDPQVLDRHRYFPMAIGHEITEAIGRKSELPLLATDSASLHNIPIVISPTISHR